MNPATGQGLFEMTPVKARLVVLSLRPDSVDHGMHCLPFFTPSCAKGPLFGSGLINKNRVVDRPGSVLPQKLNEFGQSTLLIAAQIKMDMPAQIIFAEFPSIFGPAIDDVIQCLQPEPLSLPQQTAQRFCV